MSINIRPIIVSAIFIQIIHVSLGNDGYITVLDIYPVSNPDSEFQCYTPFSYIGYILSYGRSYKIEESDDLSEWSSWIQKVDLPHRYLTGTKWNMGVYFCKIVIDGKITIVQTTKIRRDAEITPSNSKRTLTVNVGDDVTISFDGKHEWDVYWRKNGALLNDEASKEKNMTFNPVNTNDAGMYEVYRVGRRSERRHSFIKLIVRACPRHKWGLPECTGDCEYCHNGGVCDDVTGICICAPGFKGPTCENECGGNKFSWNCEHQCTRNDVPNACMEFQFCLPDPYGCSCVTGFKGQNCSTECEFGKFGADCAQSCHCNKGECDPYTGQCTNTEDPSCAHPWNGTNCQECQHPFYGENCEFECTKPCKCHRVTGKCIEGKCHSSWLNTSCETGILNTTFSSANNGSITDVYCTIYNGGIEDVQPFIRVVSNEGTEYIAASSSTSNGQNVMTYAFLVTSELYSTYRCVLVQEKIVAQMDITPEIFYLPSYNGYIKTITASGSSIIIEWTAWNNKTDDGDGPITGYYLNYKMSNSENWENKQYHESLTATVTGLRLGTNYTFAVSAVRPGKGGEGPVGKRPLTVTTTTEENNEGGSSSSIAASVGFVGIGFVFTLLIMVILIVCKRILRKKRNRSNGTETDSRDQTNAIEANEPVYFNRNPYEKTIEPVGETSKNLAAAYYVNTATNSRLQARSNEGLEPTDDQTYCEIRNTQA